MTDADDDLENLLRGLPLRRPTARLDGRIAASVARRWHPVRWAAAAAGVAAAVTAAVWSARPSPPPSLARAGPAGHAVSVEREVSQTFDDGIVSVNGRVPYRQVRQQTVRDIWWVDPTTGARLWARLPTERVTVEPAETF